MTKVFFTAQTSRSVVLAALLAPVSVLAQSAPNPSPDGLWQSLSVMPLAAGRQAWVRPPRFKGFRLEPVLMEAALGQAPSEAVPRAKRVDQVISLPRPDGTYEQFSVIESPVMEDELAAKFPTIKTYSARGIDDPTARARLDLTPLGFHAQVFSARGGYYIDPYWRNDRQHYASYFVRDYSAAGKDWTCGVISDAAASAPSAQRAGSPEQQRQNGDTLRKFRVAIAAPGEYTTFYGGTVTGALAGLVTTLNRVNQLYENDLAIRMLLVSNNTSIIYTNASTDPYTTTSCNSAMLTLNQNNIDSSIGSANYDIGHVVNNSNGGGLAGLGVVCTSGQKARGCTGSTSPIGDPFDIDYVAHEMGHQFGGDHTFNGTSGSCSGSNRNGPTAYEPGSGSTIMAYAGICGVDDLQPHSDAYFHFASVTQILGYVESSGTCSTNVATGNSMPTVNAGPNYTIPKGTPFELTASGSDGDGDTLTYCWEEKDLGAAQALSAADNGASPLFRTYTPTTNTSRMFPQLARILSNTSSNDEKLPSLARTMTFRVTVRDNRAGGGGVNDDDAVLTVVTSAGPFKITAPNSAASLSGLATVTWDVVGTALSPVNATNVNILLSTDGGQSFGTMLVSNTANDGSQIVTLPAISTTNARIKVRATTNIFFDISDANLTIVPSGPYFDATDVNTIDDTAGNNSGGIDPGETGVKLYVQIQNTGVGGGTGLSATLTSLTAAATITTPTSSYPNIAASATASNNSAFVLSLSAGHACASPINLRLRVASNESTNTTDFSISPGTTQAPVTNSFTVSANIPDNNSAGTNVSFSIGGLGTIRDLDFRFDGASCSTATNATGVGLTHSYAGDLIVKLTSPEGTIVVLIDRPVSAAGNNSGNNFCGTRLDDDGAPTNIQTAASAQAPFTGTWLPANALSAFDGESPNGTWILNVSDRAAADTGTVRAFSLIIAAGGCAATSNSPPVVDAGTNVTISLPTSNVVLNATVSDDGQPSGVTNFAWSKQSGAGTVTFAPSANVEDPTATFSSTGVYVLVLAVSDGSLTNSDTVQITVSPVSNQAPAVDAGKDETITLPTSNIVLDATVTDDGLPSGVTNMSWSKQSGPGTVSFTPSATVEDPTAIFATSGVYVLLLTASDGSLTNSDTIQVTVQAAAARVTFFNEPMSTNPGWTADSTWAFGVPQGAGGSSGTEDPTTGFTGTNVYGYNLAGDYTINLPEKYLTTPTISCSGYTNIVLSFRRWLGVERALYDHAYIRASTNGTTWVEVWANPDANLDDGAWTAVEYDISAIADRQTNIYLRWVMGDTDTSVRYCGWNIDDVQLSGYVAGPADTDGDGIPDFWESGHGLNPSASNAPNDDADGDLVTDVNEYIADTVPTNGASYLKLNVISNTGPRSIIFGPSSTGRIYTLQYVDELMPGVWSNIPEQVDQPGDGTSQDVLSDTNGTPSKRLYRIGVELP